MFKIIIKIVVYFFIFLVIVITFINLFPKQAKKIELYLGVTGIMDGVSNINKKIKKTIYSIDIREIKIWIFNSVNIDDISKLKKKN